MKFNLSVTSVYEPPGSLPVTWSWTATVQDEVVAISPTSYETEKEARSAIAKARKAFAGAKFAKVVGYDEA